MKIFNVKNDEQYQMIFESIFIMIKVFTSRILLDISIMFLFQFSIYRLLNSEQNFIKKAVQSAANYWSQVIRPKHRLNDRIRLTR